MADSITSPLNGIRFDTSKLADIQTPLGLAQQSVSTTPQVMPVTKTPLALRKAPRPFHIYPVPEWLATSQVAWVSRTT